MAGIMDDSATEALRSSPLPSLTEMEGDVPRACACNTFATSFMSRVCGDHPWGGARNSATGPLVSVGSLCRLVPLAGNHPEQG